ncbi:MAG: phosphoribosyltransferase family protein [Brachymonas sp.]|nr:phosphoribosyltransferase family protein [Brachymonas sp.]
MAIQHRSSGTPPNGTPPALAQTPSQPGTLEAGALCADCLRQPLAGVDTCHAAVSYAWPWQQCVDGFKFGAQTGWAHAFAELMLQNTPAQQALRGCDWLIPMPLHPLRLAERGFNQSLLLAQALRAAAHRQQPLSPHQARLSRQALLRVRHTQTQSRLPLAARLRNVHGAFAVTPEQVAALKGKRIALVDDVMTSGASVLAAAQALRAVGVTQLQVLVFARTEKS